MANADSFRVSFRRVCRAVLPQAIFILLLAGMARGQSGTESTLTFRTAQVPSDSGVLQVLTADFDGDGNQDLVFLQVFRLTVVLGNGDGTFRPPIHTPVTATPYFSSMAVGDFNHDGKVDVAVLGSTSQGLFLETYLGRGDGTFSEPISSPSSSAFAGPPLEGDVNHDGNLDLIGDGVVALGAGDGTFPTTITASACFLPPVYLPGASPGGSDFTVADFKGDGNLDFSLLNTVLMIYGAFGGTASATGTVCFGNGGGTFTPGPTIYSGGGPGSYASGFASFLVTTGDFNGDGKADALVFEQQGLGGSFEYSTILGNGDGTFQAPMASAAVKYVALSSGILPKPVVADMNGDGKSDLVQIAGSLGTIVLLSNGDGTYTQAAAILPGVQSVTVAVADFNNDGLPDIVSSTANATAVSINTTLRVDAVVNAASLAANQPVAPGSLVTIFGAGIGPPTGVARSGDTLEDSMAGVSVTFNGIAAPLDFVSARQINAQVPWEISDRLGASESGDHANVVVTVNGAPTASFRVATASIAPAVFESSGQAFAFNSDGTLAGPAESVLGVPSHPAVAGDTLTVLANGLGPVTPAIADAVASSDALRMAGPTPVFIGGVACDVPFAGLSSTQVGVNQLRVVVPAGVHGVVPLQINAGGMVTSADVRISVR
jgi:uncharacterized protein (TIGR03437 family)